MKKQYLILSLFLIIIFLSGCETVEVTKYVCSDKSIVNDVKDCIEVKSKTETKTITNEIIKYQCYDGSYVDNKLECPEPQKEKEVVYVKDYSQDDSSSSGTSYTGTFTGDGTKVTNTFYLNKGIVVFSGKHSGERNFAVKLVSRELEYPYNEYLIFNEIGSYEGTTTENLYKSGNYFLDVLADGSWTVEIK